MHLETSSQRNVSSTELSVLSYQAEDLCGCGGGATPFVVSEVLQNGEVIAQCGALLTIRADKPIATLVYMYDARKDGETEVRVLSQKLLMHDDQLTFVRIAVPIEFNAYSCVRRVGSKQALKGLERKLIRRINALILEQDKHIAPFVKGVWSPRTP